MAKIPKKARTAGDGECDCSTSKRRGGIEIVMDCSSCSLEPSLENQRCFRNVLAAVQREGVPVAVTLRSHVERRYGLEACKSLGRISEILNKLDSLQSQLARDSAKTENCAACVKPWSGKLGMICNKLRGMDLNGAVSYSWDLDRGDFGYNRSSCSDCSGMTRVQMADVAKALRGLEKAVTRDVIGTTGAE